MNTTNPPKISMIPKITKNTINGASQICYSIDGAVFRNQSERASRLSREARRDKGNDRHGEQFALGLTG
jgi:hypothetical protein